ncbi:hypothetical protein GCM10009564_20790 [Streptomyces thermogriseus]|uniref:Uncharacterized protein n=1 Tax=Streptomyces thermogriseus TaxID=75292 RepID=A0ABN1SXB7_9ACTN
MAPILVRTDALAHAPAGASPKFRHIGTCGLSGPREVCQVLVPGRAPCAVPAVLRPQDRPPRRHSPGVCRCGTVRSSGREAPRGGRSPRQALAHRAGKQAPTHRAGKARRPDVPARSAAPA